MLVLASGEKACHLGFAGGGGGRGGRGRGQVALELVQMTVSATLFLIPVRYFLLPLIYLSYRGVLYATLLIVQYS